MKSYGDERPVAGFADQPLHKLVLFRVIGKENAVDLLKGIRRLQLFHFLIIPVCNFGVQPEAWGPMAEGKHGIFTHPVLTEIGAKYGKTAAQVALRWNAQRGVVIIPKSVHKERMEENLNIWDFRLSGEDMEAIGSLDLGYSESIDHSAADTAKFLNGWKIHE